MMDVSSQFDDTKVDDLDIFVPEVSIVEDTEVVHLNYHTEVSEDNPNSFRPITRKQKKANNVVKKKCTKIKINLDRVNLSKVLLDHACRYCEEVFDSEEDLSAHLSKKHNPNEPFNCDSCDSSYASREYLDLHCITHKGQQYKRDVCSKKFATKKLRTERARTHSKNNNLKLKYQCDICEKKFVHKASLHSHILLHTAGLVFPCGICKKEFNKPKCLSIHMMVHRRKYACDICERRFTTKAKLDKHMTTHVSGHNSHVCHVCFHAFPSKYHMDKHIAVHEKEGLDTSYDATKMLSRLETSSIQECRSIASPSKSQGSVAEVIIVEEKFKCHDCNQILLTAEALDDHKRTHMKSKHVCGICKKVFKLSYYLKLHTRMHTGEKPYECNVCDKKFATASKVGRHMKVHTGQKDHICVTCDRTFTTQHYLRRHMHTKSHMYQVENA